MMLGVGTDICSLGRIERLCRTHADRFAERVLTPAEYADFVTVYQGNTAFLARRFALKEAVSKALGTGIGGVLGFHDIEISKTETGQPVVTLLGGAAQRFADVRLHVSVSDEKDGYAVAFAVGERVGA